MQGIITVKAVNIHTGEVEHEHTQSNILTRDFARALFTSALGGSIFGRFYVHLSTGKLQPGVYQESLPSAAGGFVTVLRSGDVFGVGQYSFIDETANSPAIIQYSSRFTPPAAGSTRNIKSVFLNESSTTVLRAYAYTELSIPCIQTDSQYYDIYYRVNLDYTEVPDGISRSRYYKTLKRKLLNQQHILTDTNYSAVSQFPKLKVRTGDSVETISGHLLGRLQSAYGKSGLENTNSNLTVDNNSAYYYGLLKADGSTNYNFTHHVGVIHNALAFISGVPYYSANSLFSTNIYQNRSKIQNLFGYAQDSTNRLAHPFLDIDNLATGSGSITLSGDWIDEETPTDPNLYYKTHLPKRIGIHIQTSGVVGVSDYKLKTRTYLNTQTKDNVNFNSDSNNLETWADVYGLHSEYNSLDTHLSNKGLLGDVNPANYTVEQISAVTAYDDSAVLVPKKNEVILYSIAASRYWRITGAFTNIHQLAVLGDEVWIACRATGLYKVNPRISLVAQKQTVTGYRTANFDNCNGVHIGYGGKIWALGSDALASYNGSVWTVYDSTTTPAFTTTNYNNVSYFKVDEDSTADQMLFVYKRSFTNTKLGFWWSTATSVVETGAYAGETGYRSAKTNKCNLVVVNGYYWFNDLYRFPFGSTAAPLSVSVASNSVYFTSTAVVKLNGVKKLLNIVTASSTPSQIFYNADGTIFHQQTNYGIIQDYGYLNAINANGGFLSSIDYPASQDCFANIVLDSGVLFQLSNCYHPSNQGNAVTARAIVIGQDGTPHGGVMRDIAYKHYGWDGANWVRDHAGSKPTHSNTQPLLEGVGVTFTNGTTGSSFVLNNVYKFAVCKGILKDNATRLKMTIPLFYTKTATGQVTLTSDIVPAVATLQTGIVGLNPVFKTRDTYLNASNRIVFTGNGNEDYAIGDKQVTGNFEISISCADIGNTLQQNKTFVGVGKAKRGSAPAIAIWFDSSTTAIVRTIGTLTNRGKENLDTQLIQITGLTTSSTVGIKRIDNTFQILKNGVSVHTVTHASVSSMIGASDTRLDIMFGVTYASQYQLENRFAPLTSIVSNGSDNVLLIGNQIQGTEVFDVNSLSVVTELPITGTLNGINAVVKTDGTLPSPGEMSLDRYTFAVSFHPSDQGKNVTLSCTRVWSR